MNLSKKFIVPAILFTLFLSLASPGNAGPKPPHPPSLEVFIKDEGFHEKNIVKPRIYVTNRGPVPIESFKLYYYITVENHKTPIIETYYVPSAQVFLEHLKGPDYVIIYHFNGLHLKPGESFPGKDGCVIGIHYPDWSPLIKNNDYSNPGSPDWRPTRRVKVEIKPSHGPRPRF